MHCQNYFYILALFILSLTSLVKAEDNFDLTTKKTPDKTTISIPLLNELFNANVDLESTTIGTIKQTNDTHQNEKTNNLNLKTNLTTTDLNADSKNLNKSLTTHTTSNESKSASFFDYYYPTTSSSEATTTIETTTNKDDQTNKVQECIFFIIFNNTDSKILYLNESFQNGNDVCLSSENLNLTKEDTEFDNTFKNSIINHPIKLPSLKDKDNDEITWNFYLNPTSNSSFNLTFNQDKITKNETLKFLKYAILLTLYEGSKSIGKLFIIGRMNTTLTKNVTFLKLKNAVYSFSLNLLGYSKAFRDDDFTNRTNGFYYDDQTYLIKIWQIARSPDESLNSNSQIIIYTITSLVLLALICGLLYFRRHKFKSLIHNLDASSNNHQIGKYYSRSPNNNSNNHHPKINISNYENNHLYNENSPFDNRFLKNTAQLNSQDRVGAFNFRNKNRDKLSLSKSSIGRVLEQSVATIRKRTTLKSINASNIEFDLKNIDTASKYSSSIALSEFLPHLNELTKTNCQKLSNEFMQLNILSNEIKKSNKIARNSKNIQKNKDGSILPFDHSRIVLEQNIYLDSDYINASYIPGINSTNEYIACQCPLKSTTYSFWLMCLQQNVTYIVMATQLVDSQIKMDKYWPDMISQDGECMKHINNITIKLRHKRETQFFTQRLFEVKMNNESKHMKHYQLTNWIENDNYQNIKMITEFLKFFRDDIGYTEDVCLNQSPIVVHCSNGVDKTAIFIAIDRIYVQLKKGKDGCIDIFKTVLEMRQHRAHFVQNELQYKLIYECVGELISEMYPSLVKQMEFDSQLDEINLKETNDFDSNNNLDSSFNSQKSLMNMLKNSQLISSKSVENKPQLNGYTNHTFVPEKNSV